MKLRTVTTLSLLAALSVCGLSDAALAKKKTTKQDNNDAAAVLAKRGDCKTELSWMKQSGQEGLLHCKGPITVYCPSDAAYGKMAKERQAEILNDKNKLSRTMKYHVAKGKVMAADIKEKDAVPTMVGEFLMTNVRDGKPTVDGCLFAEYDIPCSNGVIHILDEVPVPERGK